jgi:hypothetical protein
MRRPSRARRSPSALLIEGHVYAADLTDMPRLIGRLDTSDVNLSDSDGICVPDAR